MSIPSTCVARSTAKCRIIAFSRKPRHSRPRRRRFALLAFEQLFVSGRRGWLRHFLRDARLQAWALGTFRVLSASPRCTIGRFRKFIGRHFERQTMITERMNTLIVWEQEDAAGASLTARAEYDRL